jgi:hypothetical protein
VLVWINGPFGVGKTQTAFELARRLPGSLVSDPEHLGFGLHRMLPPQLRGDFQDLPAWRTGTVEVLDRLLTEQDEVVIVPMTVTDPRYFAETVGRLRERGHDVRHFALLASRDAVLRRLRERVLGHAVGAVLGRAQLRRESFAVRRLDGALQSLREPVFAEQMDTDALDLPAVVERIAERSGLALAPDDGNPVRRRLRTMRVGLRHVRFD